IVLKGNNKAKDRDEGFIITAASEIMAVLCNSLDMEDLKRRLGNIIVGFNSKEMPVYAKDLKVQNAMAKLLKDAINPNLVQTLEGTPAIVHLGPFANIAHGCNSIRATKLARRLSKWTITEAGFGADLGAEKFIDFKCRKYGLNPNAVVLVVTIKALKLHGEEENGGLTAIKIGFENARKHIDNIQKVWNKPCIVAINKFDGDTEEELAYVKSLCEKAGAKAEVVSVFQNGGKGAINLASLVMEVCSKQNTELKFAYNINDNIKTKCEDLAKNIYGAKKVIFSEQAKEDLKLIKKLKLDDLPIIVAKTQYSFSSDAKLVNAPKNFDFVIQRFEIRGGAEFIVAIAGDMLLMPALNKRPRAIKM
ncbi:MAG: formate--tetrahydrofolate ligase, partial [Clostridia bacterium]|nr:formate--tetrahydrofolate ligase [Clostridia bacterium]